MDLDKKFVKLGQLNELAYEDLILSINTSFLVRKVVFGLVKNTKSANFLEKNHKIAWDRLISKYALHTALFLLKLMSKFHDSQLSQQRKTLMSGF